MKMRWETAKTRHNPSTRRVDVISSVDWRSIYMCTLVQYGTHSIVLVTNAPRLGRAPSARRGAVNQYSGRYSLYRTCDECSSPRLGAVNQ